MKFYTNCFTRGNYVYIRGYNDGRPFKEKVEFAPTVFVSAKIPESTEEWATLFGDKVYPMNPGGIRDTKDFLKKYEDVHGFNVYSGTGFAYEYISDTWSKTVPYDVNLINTVAIDIETDVTLGRFPDPSRADEEIVLITVKSTKQSQYHTFTFKDTLPKESAQLHIATDEKRMLLDFLEWWSNNSPDSITGWNTEGFDIPYLHNRITNVLGEDFAKRLSPWGFVYGRETKDDFGNLVTIYDIQGINHLDYLALYKKFILTKQESYKLDHIGEIEVNEKKVSYEGSFKNFLDTQWEKFVEYNIQDVALVNKIDDKLKLLDLAYSIAYYAKVNPDNVYSPVKLWDNIIYNHLKARKVVIPNMVFKSKTEKYDGAYVLDPIIGRHEYVASFDLTSLYPHLIMGSNISPETLQLGNYPNANVETLLDKSLDTAWVKEMDVSLCASSNMFTNKIKGVLPELMEIMFNRRKAAKREMLDAEQELEFIEAKSEKYANLRTEELAKLHHEVSNNISRLDNEQSSLKILLNSCYGALGTPYFRYYDIRLAESITLNGQLGIRWITNRVNTILNKIFKTENVQYVIAGDTDSIYICLNEMIEQHGKKDDVNYNIDMMTKFCQEVLQDVISKGFDELADYLNSYEQKMFMKLEVISDVGIWVAKKNYCLRVYSSEGVKYNEPKLKVMGLAMVRSSTPTVVRKKLREILPVILNGEQEKLYKYIEDFRTEFKGFEPHEIAFPRSVNGVNEYRGNPIYKKGTPIAVRAALLYNSHIRNLKIDGIYPEIKAGEKIKFLYVKKPNPFHEDVIGFPEELPQEFGLEPYVDYDKQFQKTFIDAIEKILTPIGWTTEHVSTLDDFFG